MASRSHPRATTDDAARRGKGGLGLDPPDERGSMIYRTTIHLGLPALVAVWTLVLTLLAMLVTVLVSYLFRGGVDWQDLVLVTGVTIVLAIPIATRIGNLMRSLNRHRAELHRLTMIDTLTGIANRDHFYRFAEARLAQITASSVALCALMIDVDYFKSINDDYGHAAGDAVLVEISRLLREQMRPTDLVARFGGEEFAVLMPATNQASALSLAEALRRAVAESATLRELAHRPVTVSIGLAESRGSVTIDPVMLAADRALYAAKASGRNRCAFQDVAAIISETAKRRALGQHKQNS